MELLKITLDEMGEIDQNWISGFKLISDMNEGLPHGYIEISDKDGSFLAAFDHISIGTKIKIDIYFSEMEPGDISAKKKPMYVEHKDYYITRFEADCRDNPTKMAGTLRIFFGHAWLLFKDIKNHAYEPTVMTDLIIKILESEDRGLKFEIEDKSKEFSKSDDRGEIPRYKVNETDWDFIQNKLLPYMTSEQNMLHFFCNDKNKFLLKSFKQLYKENCKFMFVPEENSFGDQKLIQFINKHIEQNGIIPQAVKSISGAKIWISNSTLNKEIFPSFYIENVVNGTGISGGKMITNMIAPHIQSSFGTYLPFHAMFTAKATGSSTKVIHNRPLDDSVFLLFTAAKEADNIFRIKMDTEYNGRFLNVGEPAFISIPYVPHPIDGHNLIHWAVGKWLCTRQEHTIDTSGEDKSRIMSSSYLSRSNFIGDERSTSIMNLPMIYESPQ